MTSAIAWAIPSGELWRIRVTSLLGWAWEIPLLLEGTADIDKYPTSAVDPGTFNERFAGDSIDLWIHGWHLLAGIYGSTYGVDAYDDWITAINFAVQLHRSRPVFHSKVDVSQGLYDLAYHW